MRRLMVCRGDRGDMLRVWVVWVVCRDSIKSAAVGHANREKKYDAWHDNFPKLLSDIGSRRIWGCTASFPSSGAIQPYLERTWTRRVGTTIGFLFWRAALLVSLLCGIRCFQPRLRTFIPLVGSAFRGTVISASVGLGILAPRVPQMSR
jgi:hypothetical protein